MEAISRRRKRNSAVVPQRLNQFSRLCSPRSMRPLSVTCTDQHQHKQTLPTPTQNIRKRQTATRRKTSVADGHAGEAGGAASCLFRKPNRDFSSVIVSLSYRERKQRKACDGAGLGVNFAFRGHLERPGRGKKSSGSRNRLPVLHCHIHQSITTSQHQRKQRVGSLDQIARKQQQTK